MNKQIVSFRGTLADDIANKVLPISYGKSLGDSLFRYVRANADDLVCGMDGSQIVITRRNEQ